jgi:spore coat protein SA
MLTSTYDHRCFGEQVDKPIIYHVLPEKESFSALSGLAISRDVANLMRFDLSMIAVCESADDSWGFPEDRILVIQELRMVGRMRARKHIPLWITGPIFRSIFSPLLSKLKSGDVVWFHGQPFFAAALGVAIREKGARLIYHAHNLVIEPPSVAAFKACEADASIFVSEFVRQELLRLLPDLKNTYSIHCGADETLFYPAAPEERPFNPVPVILYVGRLHPIKGVHVLMAAMRILQERKVEVVCKVVGSSHFGGSKATAYVRKLLRDRPSNVQFKDFRIQTEIAEEYRSADILCCPSVWPEPFGNVNIEGMACGIPVVASRVGGIPEIAAEGGVILVEPNSAVELADVLQKLVEDKDIRTKVAMEGLSSFRRRFTWPTIFRQHQEVTDSLRAVSLART